MRRKLVVFCGLQGSGKGTLVSAMLAHFPQLARPVSHTTRLMRIGEIDGEHYYFISTEQFDEMVTREEFVNYACIGTTQKSGLSKKSALMHSFAVTDLNLRTACSARELLQQHNGSVLVVGVYATADQRRERIRIRQVGMSEKDIDRMIANDINVIEDLWRCDQVVYNTMQGNPEFAIEQATEIVAKFLSGGSS